MLTLYLDGAVANPSTLFIALTPSRMGPTHTANTVGFQITAAMLGGAALATGFGLIAHRFGLETLGPYLLVAAVLLTGVFEWLERHTRQAAVR